jgi:hypothetical protein
MRNYYKSRYDEKLLSVEKRKLKIKKSKEGDNDNILTTEHQDLLSTIPLGSNSNNERGNLNLNIIP